MTTVGSYEAKTHLSQLLDRVSRGEKILITRRGQPLAMLSSPLQKENSDMGKVVENMLAYRDHQKRTTGKLTIRQMIEEGRRF